MTHRHLAVHGHFYQPPRENPWLGCVEAEHNTGGFHDWNSVITGECYGPCAAVPMARKGKVPDELINLYSQISFNFGPSLLNWLECRHRGLYMAILQADRESAKHRGGHGNAIAQVYNHIIMPLATLRDKRTQIRWGLEDFRYRFGRAAEGIWLAETAVDDETLEALCEAGMKFAILAPRSLAAKRMTGVRTEEPVHPDDYTRPYLWRSRTQKGRAINLFFYSPQLAEAMHNGGGFSNAAVLPDIAEKLLPPSVKEPRLLSFASDGEDYGHHHKTGHTTLIQALHAVETRGLAKLTNFAEFSDICGVPEFEAEIVSPSAWSCPHGVGRWQDDCGCTNPGQPKDWNQKWRRPLRQAFNELAEKLDYYYEAESAGLFTDCWAARDGYISCLNPDRMSRLRGYLRACAVPGADTNALRKALKLLEMQRNRLLMFTSCGWFFDEISGIEPVQMMKYAAMAADLAAELGFNAPAVLEAGLAKCPSNLARFKTGAAVYRTLAAAAAISPMRAAAHHSLALAYRLSLPFEEGTVFHHKLTDDTVPAPGAHAYLLRTETTDTMEQHQFSSFVLKASGDRYAARGAQCFISGDTARHSQMLGLIQAEPDRAAQLLTDAGYTRMTETALLADWRRANPMFGKAEPAEKDRLLQRWTETLVLSSSYDLLTPALAAELDTLAAAKIKPNQLPHIDNLLALCADRFALALRSFSAARLEAVLPWVKRFTETGLPDWRFRLALADFLPGFEPVRAEPEFTRLLGETMSLLGLRNCYADKKSKTGKP